MCVRLDSGTMGNLIAVATHCQRGDEVILGSESHIYNYEQGGVSGTFRGTPTPWALLCEGSARRHS